MKVDRLKDLITKLGGSCEGVQTVDQAIERLCGCEIGGGGGGTFVVNFSTTDGVTINCDRTKEEIYEAVKNGSNVIGRMDTGVSVMIFTLTNVSSTTAQFTKVSHNAGNIDYSRIQIMSDDTVEFSNYNYSIPK